MTGHCAESIRMQLVHRPYGASHFLLKDAAAAAAAINLKAGSELCWPFPPGLSRVTRNKLLSSTQYYILQGPNGLGELTT